jgi:DNA polymerase
MTNIIHDIKSILEFYQDLGFEMLPIKLEKKTRSAEEQKYGKPTTTRKLKNLRTSVQKEAALKALSKDIGDCKMCRLSKERTNIVFGEGNPDAKLMFIGEGPGREEDSQGRPFVGDAGMLLTRLIEKMGFKRKDVYIANIVKCRPPMNRDPEKDEIESCRGFVEKQIEIIEPEVIISLGRISAQTLLGSTRLKMTSIRGNFFDYKGIPLMPTFHPAYLLRNPKDKWLTWSDAQKVLEKLKEVI